MLVCVGPVLLFLTPKVCVDVGQMSRLRLRARSPVSGPEPELGLAKGRRASVALQILFYSVTLRNACVTLALHPIFYSVTPFPTFQDIKDREKYWKT